ncbi:peptidoglycan-binding domain-containing protein [Corallococcus macrosporus]|uniref:Peptidoglycan binding-like domain-containing protein n=2 Tax=Myxococcaceae TaxID=31 RepID=A0A250JSE7_9BACT|nr:hypothetical protein [Corallococcus macrosporus]AEI65632.1 hypothetical protein LILAB_18650 [Corallococcus macrosporus]ATB46560.1 hypothetical protein MYMAC_002165 [Corallococcus macrosporus DSM 14697]
MFTTPLSVSSFQLDTANTQSWNTFGSTPVHGSTVPCQRVDKKAIEVTVIDLLGRVLEGQVLELAWGQQVYRLMSNTFGAVRFEGLEASSYPLTLLGLDRHALEAPVAEPLSSMRLQSHQPAAWDALGPLSCPASEHVVQPGEGVDKIALQWGLLPETIWDAPQNGALRARLRRRNQLIPNDTLYIPPREALTFQASTGCHYVLRFNGGLSRLRLRLAVGFEPQDGIPYLLEVPDAPTQQGTTKDGYIDTVVPTRTTRVTLVLDQGALRIDLPVDTLLPLTDDRGVQQRLRNLGFPCESSDGTFDDAAKAVLHRFRSGLSLPHSDVIDDDVRGALYSLHDKG